MTVLIRPTQILLGTDSGNTTAWTSVTMMSLELTDPWVRLPIPGGVLRHQHLQPIHVEGVLHTMDFDDLMTALTTVPIDDQGNFAMSPITGIRHRINYFRVDYLATDGSTQEALLTDVRIEKIDMGEMGVQPSGEIKEAAWLKIGRAHV